MIPEDELDRKKITLPSWCMKPSKIEALRNIAHKVNRTTSSLIQEAIDVYRKEN